MLANADFQVMFERSFARDTRVRTVFVNRDDPCFTEIPTCMSQRAYRFCSRAGSRCDATRWTCKFCFVVLWFVNIKTTLKLCRPCERCAQNEENRGEDKETYYSQLALRATRVRHPHTKWKCVAYFLAYQTASSTPRKTQIKETKKLNDDFQEANS